MIAGHGQHGANAVGLPSACAKLSLVALVATTHTSASAIDHNALVRALTVPMSDTDVWGLVLNTHVVAALVRRWTILLVTTFATDALVILTAPRRSTVFSIALGRIALTLLVTDRTHWAFIILFTVNAST